MVHIKKKLKKIKYSNDILTKNSELLSSLSSW